MIEVLVTMVYEAFIRSESGDIITDSRCSSVQVLIGRLLFSWLFELSMSEYG